MSSALQGAFEEAPPVWEESPPAVDEAAAADATLQRTVRAALVGAPNAGKSTLTNALVGSLVSAVSRKTNTTRREALGAVTRGDTQLLLYDTPGVVGAVSLHGASHSSRVSSAWRAAADAHALCFLVDAHRQWEAPDHRVSSLLAGAAAAISAAAASGGGLSSTLSRVPTPVPPSYLVLTKTDRLPEGVREATLRALVASLGVLHPFEGAFAVSALHRHGVAPLAAALCRHAVAAPWPLPAGAASDRGEIAQALAATQGALFDRLHEELPYSVALRHEAWDDFRDGSVRIEQSLTVPSHGARKIVVGAGGAAIGQIGIAARKACERAFGRRVHLILTVKVARPGRAAREAQDAAADIPGLMEEQRQREE